MACTLTLTAVSLGWIGEAIDRLADLLAEKDRVEKAERELSGAALGFLRDHNMPALRSARFTASVVERTTLAPDVAFFIEAIGGVRPAAPALRVTVERARTMLGDDRAQPSAIKSENNSPIPREVQPPSRGRIVAVPEVAGLHHRYTRVA